MAIDSVFDDARSFAGAIFVREGLHNTRRSEH